MMAPLSTGAPPVPLEPRDDRTLRALALLVGADRADVSLSHFSAGRVEVCAAPGALEAPNGLLAVTAMLNMLSRFVGTVEVRITGEPVPALDAALDAALERLRRIDTREGRSVRRVAAGHGVYSAGQPVANRPAARVLVGGTPPSAMNLTPLDPEADVHIAFDGWTCAVRRGAPAGELVASSVPFGALAATCFAVAEVFKTLVASSVPEEESGAFRKRFTHDWRFSVWAMERLSDDSSPAGPPPLDPLPALVIDGVLQVGAGAVGNATSLALAATLALHGEYPVLDPKHVDDKNLNRCYYFTERDVGERKVDVLARAATRPGLLMRGLAEACTAATVRGVAVVLSTVDNNEARHRIQEALPDVLVEGATGGTTVAVAVHTPGNGRSCLVCRHPDPTIGLTRRIPLSLAEAATATGLTEAEIAAGRVDGETAITDDVLARVAARAPEIAATLRRARDDGQDLCGALGDLRARLGTVSGPREASVPFVSNLAGVLAAAEVVKLLLAGAGVPGVPLLDNVLEVDLARNYGRHDRLSFREPPYADCALCQQRAAAVAEVYGRRRGAARPHTGRER